MEKSKYNFIQKARPGIDAKISKPIKVKLVCILILLLGAYYTYGQFASTETIEKYNPEYHFYPSADPTGLFYYGGYYFLNWGSATSKDLVHWKMTEFGLERARRVPMATGTASQPPVFTGISGTVVADWNNSSGFGKNDIPPLVALQTASGSSYILYSTDTAKTWTRYSKPTVLPNSSGGSYRDPKVFWYEPGKKWIMAMPWAEIQEIRFFSSKNLVDWQYMSKFGPWGAVNGQWECVDFSPLKIDGSSSNMKWVLTVSLQPRNGQYFIGDFDGERFTMDKSFITELSYKKYFPQGEMLFDFERGIDDWKIEGNAFNSCPSSEEGVNGIEGKRCIKSDPLGTGKITSPEFVITKKYINFLIGGGYYPGDENVNLLVNGNVVRSQTGNSGNAHVEWAGWDVTEFIGKKARIEIVDNKSAAIWLQKAYVYCDAIMLADELLPRPPYEEHNYGWEKAFWSDWGADFYAARTWANLAPGDNRTIWVGWMGSWKYFNAPVRGNFSIPRSLELKTFPEGIRLIQTPIKELESLRTIHKTAEEKTFEGVWTPKRFSPSKNSFELVVEFEHGSAEEFGIKVAVGENQKTVVGYNMAKEELYLDRRKSGYDEFSPVFPSINKAPLKLRTKTTKLRIFVDKCSIEIFGNDGETVMSSKIYPDPKSVGIELFANGGNVKVKSLELWELDTIKLY